MIEFDFSYFGLFQYLFYFFLFLILAASPLSSVASDLIGTISINVFYTVS